VSEPVGGDALGGDPGESVAEAFPEVVVSFAGEWVAVAESEQQRVGGEYCAAGAGVISEAVGEGGFTEAGRGDKAERFTLSMRQLCAAVQTTLSGRMTHHGGRDLVPQAHCRTTHGDTAAWFGRNRDRDPAWSAHVVALQY
jgi:hypothetical protein